MIKQVKTYFLNHFEIILKTLGLISILYSMWASQYQIAQSRISEEKNLDWQRKTLTQEKIDNRSTSQLTDDISRRRKVLKKSLSWIYSDSSLRTNVRTRLNFYESLCRGIKIGIYDESVVKMSIKATMLQAYNLDKILIDSMTKKRNRPVWSEFL